MSDISTATEQKIYKTKLCPAVFPALFLLFAASITVFTDFVMVKNGNFASEEQGILSVTSAVVTALCWLAFIIILFIRKPNIIVPVSLGATRILPTFINIVGYSILSKIEGWEYNITLWTVFNIFFSCIATAAGVLLVLKSPAIKAFMKKTAKIWIITIPLIYLVSQTTFCLVNYFDILTEDPMNIAVFLADLLSYSTHAAMLLLLYRWLANPYKEVKPAPQKPAAVPQYTQYAVPVHPPVVTPIRTQAPPQPVAPVQPQFTAPVQASPVMQPVVMPTISPVVQPPVVTPASAQAASTVADEISKYKDLLDSGAITPEEFEALKTKLINKL